MKASLQQQPMYCSRDHNYTSRLNQQYEKSTQYFVMDIDNPAYFQRLVSPFNNVQITPLSNEMAIWKFLNSPACKVHPYACQSKMKFEQYWLEIQYILRYSVLSIRNS